MKNLRAFEIIAYLKKKKHCSMLELMEQFNVSQATVHRDVNLLVDRGLVQKLHGGVSIVEQLSDRNLLMGSHFTERLCRNRAAKTIISDWALSEIEDGDILFLDSSTTVYYLAERLWKSQFSSLTVITNSIPLIQQFPLFPQHYILIGIGGTYDLQTNAFLGESALAELDRFSISKAFISAYGIHKGLAATNHEQHAVFLRRILALSAKTFLMADSTKFDRPGLFRIGEVEAFTKVFSSSDMPE